MKTLRFGIIGCGDFGMRHAKRLDAMPGVVVAALSDPRPEAVERVRQALSRAPELVASDHRDLLACGLDAVCIASPDSYHVRQVLDALSAGAHVLCEKPLTPDAAELDRVVRARDRTGKVVALTYPRRYDPSHRAMRREILSGRWGTVTAITVYNAEDWITPNRGTWRHDPTICPGGFFYDASGHQLDMIMWATGLSGLRVRAWSDNAGAPVPIRVWGAAALTGDVPVTFHFVGDAHVWREIINIHCEGRDFCVQNFRAMWCPLRAPEPIEPSEPGEGPDAEFVSMIRDDAPNPAPPEGARHVLRFTEAALRSAACRRSVRVRD